MFAGEQVFKELKVEYNIELCAKNMYLFFFFFNHRNFGFRKKQIEILHNVLKKEF